MTPKFKKAGPNGELEITFPKTMRQFRIEKQLDHNERHKGEWKVMEWDPRKRDWEWHNTFSPLRYAKEKVMDMGKYTRQGKKVEEDATTTASIPNPADTAMGPKFKAKTVTDRRRKKEMVLLKRFRKYMEDNG
jgi:hypothetical protein